MRLPIIQGIIDRRILVNYRVDPLVLSRLLPSPFRPQLVHGFGMAGICLIRLKNIRPRCFPAFAGIRSENAAHRIAVEWNHGEAQQHGVYVPRRDTSSRLNTLAGGRLFPGVHHHAHFQSVEKAGHYAVQLTSDDGDTHLRFAGRVATTIPSTSIFDSLEEASRFFEGGSLGYSATARLGTFDGLELRTKNWHLEPLEIEEIASSYFENQAIFPPGSVEFDSAFLMHGIEHEWHSRKSLHGTCCEAA